jgi:preprotein translocase subunit SecG
VMKILQRLRDKLPQNFIARIYKFAGILFLVFAVVLAFHVVTGTDWGSFKS